MNATKHTWKFFRAGDGWQQLEPVEHDEDSVTVEVTSLRTAAAGIVLRVSSPSSSPFSATCVPGSGTCIEEVGGALRAGAAPQTLSDVVDGRFFYLRQSAASQLTLVEHDLAAGKSVRESQALEGAPTGAIELFAQHVSPAPDGTVWAAIGGFGTVQFAFPGAPTRFADGQLVGRTRYVAHNSAGLQRRLGVRTTTQTVSGQKLTIHAPTLTGVGVGVSTAAPKTSSLPLTFAVAPFVSDGRILLHLLGAPYLVDGSTLAFTSAAAFPFPTGHNDCVAVTPSVSAWATSSPTGKVQITSAAGTVKTFDAAVDLSELEFTSDGVLWGFSRVRAEVFRFDPDTGGLRTISLTDAAPDTAAYRARVPQAIRRLSTPAGALLVVVGDAEPRALRLVPSP